MKTEHAFNTILVIRRDNIGDLLCTTPMIHALRKHYPDAQIAVLANSYNAPVLENNPDIDQVYHYTKAKHSKHTRIVALFKEWRLFRKLKKQRFDLIIQANPTPNRRNTKLTRYLKPGVSLGVGQQHGDYDITIDPSAIGNGHHVTRVMRLLLPLGVNSEPTPMVLKAKQAYTPNSPAIVGIHLSSRKPNNRWPAAHYETLAASLMNRGYEVRLFWAPGSQANKLHPGDDELAQTLGNKLPKVTLVPTSQLHDLIDQLNLCDIIICPDGGTLHIATALQKPLIALFGCTDSIEWGPWHTQSIVLNGNGEAASITVDDVLKAFTRLSEDKA